MFKKMWCKLFHKKYHQRDHSDLKFTSLDVSIWWCQHSCDLCGCAWLVEDKMGRGITQKNPVVVNNRGPIHISEISPCMIGGETGEVVFLRKVSK